MNRHRTIQVIRGSLLAIVLVALAVELAGELGALTPWIADKLQSRLTDHGLRIRVERARVGIFAGIRLREVTLRDAGDKAVRLAHAKRIRGSINFGALLHGSVRLRSASLADVSIFVPPDQFTPALRPMAHIERASARVHSNHIRVETLRGTFRQLPISAAGTLRSLGTMFAETAGKPQHALPKNWSWAGADTPKIKDAPPLFRRILNDLQNNTFSEADSGLDIAFELPLDNPKRLTAAGTLALTNFFLLDTPVRTLKGTGEITPSTFKISSWTAFLDDGTTARGALDYDRREQRISGQLHSSLSVIRLRNHMKKFPAPAETFTCPAPLTARISLDPSPPNLESLAGTLQISAPQLTCQMTNLGALQIKGAFKNGTIDLPTVTLSNPGEQPDTLTGNLAIDTQNKTFTGHLTARLPSAELLAGFPVSDQLPPALSLRADTSRDKVELTAEDSPWPGSAMRIRGSANLTSLILGDLPLQSTRFGFETDGPQLQLSDLRITGESAEPDSATASPVFATGSARANLADKTLSADLRGAITAPRLHDLLRPLLPESALAPIGRSGRLAYQLTLNESPLEWTKWTGTADLEISKFKLAGVADGNLRIPLEFSETELRGDNLTAKFANGPSASGSFRLTRPALQLNADLQGTTSSAFLTSLLPEPAASGKLSHLDVDAMDIALKIEKASLKTPGWTLSGTLSTGAGTLENFAFDSISDASFTLVRSVVPQKRIEFDCRVPTVDMGAHSYLRDVNVTVRAGAGVTVHVNGHAQAAPEFVRAFIFGPRFQRRYERIWNDFRWNEKSPPRTHLKSLHFHDNFDKENKHWFLRMEAETSIPGFRYRAIRARNLTGTVLLDLPAQVRLKDLAAKIPDTPENGDIEGDVTFLLKNNPRCRFTVNGTLDANRILASVIPDWPAPSAASPAASPADSSSPPVSFTPPTIGSFTGTIPLADPNALTLSGSVKKAAEIILGPIPFQNASGQWQWTDKCLTIKNFAADLHHGRFSGNGQYCFVTRNGNLAFDAANVRLQPLLAKFGETEDTDEKQQKGRLDVTNADIGIHHTGDDNTLGLGGTAKLELEESDLWKIPLFSKLASVLNVSIVRKIIGLGDITALSTNLEFENGTVLIRNFTTNGTVMSLEGVKPGSYNWRSQKLNLVLRGKILKKTIIIPFLTSPISWLFEAELHGTRTQPEWRLLNAVKEGIFGADSNKSPETQ